MSILYRPEIRFADIDSYGIVHNANYLIYFEQSRIELFNKISAGWDWKKHGVLVARQEVDYKHPVKLKDVLEIEILILDSFLELILTAWSTRGLIPNQSLGRDVKLDCKS